MDGALADDGEATRADPTFGQSYFYRGHGYRSLGDFDHAMTDDDGAVDLDPSDGSALTDRGAIRAKQASSPEPSTMSPTPSGSIARISRPLSTLP